MTDDEATVRLKFSGDAATGRVTTMTSKSGRLLATYAATPPRRAKPSWFAALWARIRPGGRHA